MISIDKVISTNSKSIRTIEGQLTLGFLNESLYENPIHLIILWCGREMFYNPYNISKDEIHIIRKYLGMSGPYGSIFDKYMLDIIHTYYLGDAQDIMLPQFKDLSFIII